MVNTVTLIQDVEGSLILHCSQNEAGEIDSKDYIESVYERLCLRVSLCISFLHLFSYKLNSCEATVTSVKEETVTQTQKTSR